MRIVAGALVMIAGAHLFGAGAVAATMAYGMQAGAWASYGGWAIFVGLVVLAGGAVIIFRELLFSPPGAPTPPV